MQALELVNAPLRRQLRALSVALRAGSSERARAHARYAVALVNEGTDLTLTTDDLLMALAEGARTNRTGAEVIERLLELGVHRRLAEVGTVVTEHGSPRFMREGDALRHEVRALLGVESDSVIDADPRWSALLAH